MADFAPPSGPPPPKVPEGWKAIWNEQYSEWFFVNVYTKKSQWDKPADPAYPHGEAPDHPPPSYAPPVDGQRLSSEKSRLGTNNPYAGAGGGGPGQNISDDEKLARQLQEEEEARARGQHHGTAENFYSQGSGAPQAGQYGYGQQNPYASQSQGYGGSGADTQDKSKSKGLLGKLLGKASSHSSRPPQQHGFGGYGQPMQGGHYGSQHGYGQSMYGQPPRRQGGGMGAGGAAALGLGGGLLGGAMLGSAMGDAGDGGGYGGDGGGDYGGDGGGDFGGGDMGGGDMGGGDMGGGGDF